MKYIKKCEEPEEFSNWKALENDNWKPSWDNFQVPQKPAVHDALLREQGYICCYCGMRITRDGSHIEHLKPRSAYPHLALEYTNLMASCQIEKLGLDIDKLRAMRREAIDAVLLDIDELTPKQIQQLMQGYEQLDANEQYTPFCAAITYILKQYFII